MFRLLAALLVSTAVGGGPATAATGSEITGAAISGARLGWTQAQYRALLGRLTVEHLELGYTRLTGPRNVAVYLEDGRGVAIVTWNRRLTDGAGIAPCSSVATLRSTYGSKLKPARLAGAVRGYRRGRLLYTTEGGLRVGAIMLAASSARDFIAYNSTACPAG